MKVLLAAVVGVAALIGSPGSPCAAQDTARVRAYRVEPTNDGEKLQPDAAKLAADILLRRCKHAGLDVAAVEVGASGDRVAIRLGPKIDDGEAAVRRLAERRGFVEFRIRAQTRIEDAARFARLNAGAMPPPGFEWRMPEDGVLQILVETPEKAAAAALEAAKAKSPPDEAAVKATEVELERTGREEVFTNADVGETSVRRTMSSHGAARFLRIAIRFELREDRRAAFEKFTGGHLNRGLAVVLDGKVHVCPVIKSALPGMGELTGPGNGYTDAEAQELAAIFASGALPCRLVPAETK